MSEVRAKLRRIREYDVHDIEEIKKRMREEIRAYELRELRQQSHVTQVELARQLDVSQARISHIERGNLEKTQVDTLKRYVEALGGRLRIEVDVDDRTISLA